MSTITNNSLASYFSLNNNGTSSNSSTTGGLAEALAALTGNSSSTANSSTTSGSNSYTVDLSSEAQAYLASLTGNNSSSASSDSGSSSSSDTFLLTNAQQRKLNDIIMKYKDAPFTQDTFDQMQDDLDAAGLGADQLNAEQKMRSINPTQMLISALNGQQANLSDLTGDNNSSTDDTTKATNFMNSIIDAWRKVSTTADSTDSSTTESNDSVTAASAG